MMKNFSERARQTSRGILLIACLSTLSMAITILLPRAAYAHNVTPPPVPANIQVPAQNEAVLVGHGVGTQNYVCLPAGSGFAWTLFTPEATLFSDELRQVTTHFFSPNPVEGTTVRATWEHSRDTSTVWAKAIASSLDPNFVKAGAIPWVLLQVVGAQKGPTGGDKLTGTTFIQRLSTVGGAAPSTGCASSTDVGHTAFVPYTADYFFYEESSRR
jgi:uncharacterized protein DUF3455